MAHHIKLSPKNGTASVTERVGKTSVWTVCEIFGSTLVLGQIRERLGDGELRATLVTDM